MKKRPNFEQIYALLRAAEVQLRFAPRGSEEYYNILSMVNRLEAVLDSQEPLREAA